MLFFVIISFFCLVLACVAERRDNHILMLISALLLALYSGLRGVDVGIDTERYYFFYEEIFKGNSVFGIESSFLKFCEFLQFFSPNPALLIFVLSFFTNMLIVGRLWSFRKKASFGIMLAVYIAGYYPETMNIMRQFFAVALVFFGTFFLEKNKPLLFIPFLLAAIAMHTSSLVGVLLLFVYLWNVKDERKIARRVCISCLIVPALYLGFSSIKEAYDIYARYFDTVKQNLGFMLVYKMFGVLLVCYISKFGLIRKGVHVLGLAGFNGAIVIFYLLGICLCSLGMFFPYMDRIGLFFLMFEMVFWGWAVRSSEMNMLYKAFCCLFIFYLYIMNLLIDGQHIFPYTTIWSE